MADVNADVNSDGGEPAVPQRGSDLTIRTFGHGTLPEDEFINILRAAKVERIVDVRSFPGSRRNPQFGRQEMERWVPEAGIDYTWIQDLGGRRKPNKNSPHTTLRHVSFRSYADYMESEPFRSGIEELLGLAREEACAVMCSETVWWRCHRRLLADFLILVEGVTVLDLMHNGKQGPHLVTPGVRRDDGILMYDQDPEAD